ncbi:MAG: hypothetical protein CHACPFDD_00734 [Phycisphaerae bacterium]|nr:hypothetical protein [Phycisphaerae bacterium]
MCSLVSCDGPTDERGTRSTTDNLNGRGNQDFAKSTAFSRATCCASS